MEKKRRYMNVELHKGKEANDFRSFLKENDIYYEASEAYNMIHFEVLVNDIEGEDCNKYLSDPDFYWETERYYENEACTCWYV